LPLQAINKPAANAADNPFDTNCLQVRMLIGRFNSF
jgi:hypothetical protein